MKKSLEPVRLGGKSNWLGVRSTEEEEFPPLRGEDRIAYTYRLITCEQVYQSPKRALMARHEKLDKKLASVDMNKK